MKFADRERSVLREHAMSIFADPKSSSEDRAAARARLTDDQRELDVSVLHSAEVVLLALICAKALGNECPMGWNHPSVDRHDELRGVLSQLESYANQIRAELATLSAADGVRG
ncbi:MAG: hypothetical protein JWP01_3390 [Myxococcales bacterium]|nr:hypothetical protein [Myxococcales bacterium]